MDRRPSTTAVVATETARPSRDGFAAIDWARLAAIAGMWGSSFLFIEEGLEAFAPFLITLLRLALGAATLVWFSAARAPIERRDWKGIVVLSLCWMAGPFLLFPVAQQWIASSLAGMINGGTPVVAAVVAALVARARPGLRQMVGIVLGFAGVVAVSWPAVSGARSTALGVFLVLLATISYGIAINVAVPLQRRYGSLPVLLRAQLVAVAVTFVPGVLSIPHSSFSWSSAAAMIPLGCLGTGLAFVAMGDLVGRVGAARASLAVYFIPVVAIALGALLRDETIAVISVFGTAMVIAGAVLASRSGAGHDTGAKPPG